MYAVVEHGGKQYKVSQGDRLQVELCDVDPAIETLEFENVLLISKDENVTVGTPYIEGAKVIAAFRSTAQESIVKGPKVYPTQFRRRKNSRRRIGHRQKYHEVTVQSIDG